jgi:hypothetical protein
MGIRTSVRRWLALLSVLRLLGAPAVVDAGHMQPVITIKGGPADTGNLGGIYIVHLVYSTKMGNQTVGHDKSIAVPIAKGDGHLAIAVKISNALNADPVFKQDYSFVASDVPNTTESTVKGSPSDTRTKASTVSIDDLGPAKVGGVTSGGSIDPLIGTAVFNVDGSASGDPQGEFTIGLQGVFVSTPTSMKDIPTIKNDLLTGLHDAGFASAFINGVTGEILVPGVSTGDPLGTGGVDIGANFSTNDLGLGGLCCVTIPEPSSLTLLGLGGLSFLSYVWGLRKRTA